MIKELFTFYKALDPMKGSWDGYGYFPIGDRDFLVFVSDAPSGASIHTPEHIKDFLQDFAKSFRGSGFPQIELADALNRLQSELQLKGRQENILYQATISIAHKGGDQLFYCCIGDSALQIFRNGRLHRLNESEVWDSSLIAHSDQSPRERQRTKENRFIGSNGSFIQSSDIQTLSIKDKDILLLYSDGIEDLFPPNRILSSLSNETEEIRKQLDDAFRADRIKDDATLVAVPIEIPQTIPIEKELSDLRTHLERIQKDQQELRKSFSDFGSIRVRLEKMESSVQELLRNSQQWNKRSIAGGSGVSSRKQISIPWLVGILCLLLGTALGALIFSKRQNEQPVQTPTSQTTATPRRAVAPPEIPPEQECNYTVQKGDSLEKIATSKNISIDQILKLNPTHKRETGLKIGQVLKLCKGDEP